MAVALNVLTQLTGFLVVTLTLVWIFKFRGGAAWNSEDNRQIVFNVHPVLMVIGLVFLYSEAILAYRTFPGSKSTKKTFHSILNFVALVLGVIGIAAAIKYHNESGIANFYSLHSWFGIATITLFFVQWFGGLSTFVFPGASLPVRKLALPWHTFFGLFIYFMALATASQGLLEKSTFLFAGGLDQRSSEAILVNVLGLLVFAFGGLVVYSAIQADKLEDDDAFKPLH